MQIGAKRIEAMPLGEVSDGNRRWWTAFPMAYDWHGELQSERGSRAWFDAIDRNFVHGARLFAHDKEPFDRIIPFADLPGKRALEIGCGMGLHTELMLKAGAELSSVDISDTSIEMTGRRLRLKGLDGDVRRSDAETLPFDDHTFDFVWSWGVIHHSSRTGRIVREIARVLKPGGEARVMVYNRDGMPAWITFWTRFVGRAGFLRRSFDEELFKATDGFMARYYTRDQFEDLFRTFFDQVSIETFGQDADAMPLPRRLRAPALRFFGEDYLRAAQARRGGFLFLTASAPV